MTQIERITKMETILDKAITANSNLENALKEYLAIQDSITELAEYYYSDDWKKDYDDDNAGKLPENLQRGVLSQDGIYNLLITNKEMAVDALVDIAQLIKQGDV